MASPSSLLKEKAPPPKLSALIIEYKWLARNNDVSASEPIVNETLRGNSRNSNILQ
jgi:hypothetical protein